MVIDALWPIFQLTLGFFPRGVNIHLVVFLAWNIFFTVQWQRFLLRAQKSGSSDLELTAGKNKGLESITQREQEVLDLILQGVTNSQIAARLGISTGTSRNHIYHIYNKIGASSRKELVKMLESSVR